MRPALCFFLSALPAFATPTGFPTSSPLRFLVLGDGGTGTDHQRAVGKAMAKVCAERGCHFAVGLGDNIYDFGADSDSDRQFQLKFEEPYAALNFPFFMVLGNHDQSGLIPGSGVDFYRGNHEVKYTAKSARWMMPERYYRFAAPVASAKTYQPAVASPVLELFAIDTNPLAPQNMPRFDFYKPGAKYDLEQRAWLRKSLSESKATWKAVMGHHPFLSNGHHGGAGEFGGLGLSKGMALKEFYLADICDKVDFIFNGHEHSMQWLSPVPSCGKTQFLVSGAAGKKGASSDRGRAAVWEAYNTLGFFWLEASSEQMRIVGYTVNDAGVPEVGIDRAVKRPVKKL